VVDMPLSAVKALCCVPLGGGRGGGRRGVVSVTCLNSTHYLAAGGEGNQGCPAGMGGWGGVGWGWSSSQLRGEELVSLFGTTGLCAAGGWQALIT